MYLGECLIENVGPIKCLDMSMPFNDDGTPKPVVLVGENGTGKTICLSHIADALVEAAKVAFRDIVPAGPLQHKPYLKYVGPTNQRIGTEYGLALLRFQDSEKGFTYVDKSGTLAPERLRNRLEERFQGARKWPEEGNYKSVSGTDKDSIETFFQRCAICYFPSSRRESPHWLNPESLDSQERFRFEPRFTGMLDQPIFVQTCTRENLTWLLDVILDSMVDIDLRRDGIVAAGDIGEKLLLRQSRVNVERLLKRILGDEEAHFTLGLRNISPYRLSIASSDGVTIPTLYHLSSGQAILFNLFATIIRYAERDDIRKSIQPEQIEGIVVIDDIEAHLHSKLQYEVLPELIRMFPKVQFIVTSHAPLFLLGMEKLFGQNGFHTAEMPSGTPVSTERFSEFLKSLDYYKATKTYEDEIRTTLSSRSKPLILTEGQTDPIYIRTALELLGQEELLEQVSIQWVGGMEERGPFNTGVAGLNATRKVIAANPSLLDCRVLLLYDCDSNKPDEDLGLLSIRSIPANDENSCFKKGIENLLPDELAAPRFYERREIKGEYGETKSIEEFRKMDFCRWVCEERRRSGDFKGFSVVVEIIEQFLTA